MTNVNEKTGVIELDDGSVIEIKRNQLFYSTSNDYIVFTIEFMPSNQGIIVLGGKPYMDKDFTPLNITERKLEIVLNKIKKALSDIGVDINIV